MDVIEGKVLTVGTDAHTNEVKVAPIEDIDAVSPYIKVPEYLWTEDIQKGDRVIYIVFGDGTGAVIAKI